MSLYLPKTLTLHATRVSPPELPYSLSILPHQNNNNTFKTLPRDQDQNSEMEAYKQLVRKCVLKAEALDPAQVISRGLSQAQVDIDGNGQDMAIPGDYACAWKILLNTSPMLAVHGTVPPIYLYSTRGV